MIKAGAITHRYQWCEIKSMNDIELKIISASLLRLRMKSPFFATLALFARFISSSEILTATTDVKDIYFNPDF